MTRGVCERKCTYCETWTRGWIAVCSDCHGERTDALCRRKRAERQVAAVREVLEGLQATKDAYLATKRAGMAERAQAVVMIEYRLRRALETE